MNAKQRRVVRREAIRIADAVSASWQKLIAVHRMWSIPIRDRQLATGHGVRIIGDAYAVYVIARHRCGRQTVLHRAPPVAALPSSE